MRKKKYWTKEKCIEESKKYSTKKDFVKNAAGAFMAMRRNGWVNEIWSNYENIKGNKLFRCVYIYEFSEKTIYIGITHNLNERNKNHHRINSPVYQHIMKTGLEPNLIQISDYINLDEAIQIEKSLIKKYRELNWTVLNKSDGGELGTGKLYWTKDKCYEAAKNCKSKKEFITKYHGAWSSAKKNNWLNDIMKIFPELRKPVGYWTIEKCIEEANKYKLKEEFRKNSPSAYTISNKNNWFKEITKHMG